jgi:hypothetical protein
MKVACYTSITSNYIPKATVLAESVKRHHPDWTFHLVMGEPPAVPIADDAPFDSVVRMEDLGIPELAGWTFSHSVVELCTGIKGPALEQLLGSGVDAVVYLDPDTVVFSPLTRVVEALDRASVVLVPHVTDPATTMDGILDTEMNALQYGVFNLGFLAVAATPEGLRFARWWRDRLVALCYDERGRGLFTDQKWCDLVPGLFPDHEVLRHPSYDVATWNLAHRDVTLGDDGMLRVGGQPLAFYHFSGYDSGAGRVMLEKYARRSSPLHDLWDWYDVALDKARQRDHGDLGWRYQHFADDTPITTEMRKLYRDRRDLQLAFPDPFAVPDDGDRPCYLRWFRAEHPDA